MIPADMTFEVFLRQMNALPLSDFDEEALERLLTMRSDFFAMPSLSDFEQC